MSLTLESEYMLDKTGIDWASLTDDERKSVSSNCCICGKEIITYKVFADNSICSKRCANKSHRRIK